MEVRLTIKNEEGLHARPAGILAKKVAEFQSTVQISANGQTKSAKSIMALMGSAYLGSTFGAALIGL